MSVSVGFHRTRRLIVNDLEKKTDAHVYWLRSPSMICLTGWTKSDQWWCKTLLLSRVNSLSLVLSFSLLSFILVLIHITHYSSTERCKTIIDHPDPFTDITEANRMISTSNSNAFVRREPCRTSVSFSQVDVRRTMISSLLMFIKEMLMSRICLSLSLSLSWRSFRDHLLLYNRFTLLNVINENTDNPSRICQQ